MAGAPAWRHLYPFDSHVADIGGWRYHYVDEGHGQPVVLVHGNPTWSFYWRELIQALRPHHRAIAPDHIGMGLSDQPSREHYSFTLERRVADFTHFIETLGLSEPVTLVVHDWGGAIGLAWAIDHVDQVDRIVVMNTAAFGLPSDKRMPAPLAFARSRPVGELLLLGANAFVEGALRLGARQPIAADVRSGYRAPYRTMAGRVAVLEFVKDIPLTEGHRSFAALDRLDRHLERLAGIPMMIAWGARDFVFDDRILAEWQRRFPEAEVTRFPDAGHFVLEDQTVEICELVLKFIG